jgi:class 3 adenylate cyclase
MKPVGSLDEWTRNLLDKIRGQVDPIDRVTRLLRYFSPQIAKAVLDSDNEHLFETHRREITVVFLDLRGFTSFSDSAEPEDVIGLLRCYHAEMGS